MDRRYKHLDSEERGVILAEHRRGASLREIGGLLGRAPSTIGRELRHGRPDGLPADPYCPQRAGAGYRARRERCGRRHKLVGGSWLHDFVRGKLIHRRWSPEQIACKLRAMHPEDPTRQISHETRLSRDLRAAAWRVEGRDDRGAAAGKTRARIATHNAVRRLYRPGIIADYPSPRRNRGPPCARALGGRSDQGGVQPLGGRHGRPAQDPLSHSQQFKRQEIDPGDRFQRRTRGCTAEAALEGFTRQMKRLPAALRKSMTYDRGSEMACHPELARRLKIDIWFCDPHQSAGKQSPGLSPDPPHTWQRGSNENTNGLLRYD